LTEGLNKEKYTSRLIAGSLSSNEGDMSYILQEGKDNIITIQELQRELNPINDLISLLKIISVINRFKPDIVHSHLSKAGTLSRIAVNICNLISRKKIKTVHTFHGHVLDSYFGDIKTFIFKSIEQILAKTTDKIIAISSTQKWELSRKFKISDASKISLINLGFDLDPFIQSNRLKGQFSRKIGVGEDTLLIGIIGRLAPIKNHKMFLDAAKYFLEISKHKKVKFLLIGDGELRPNLELYSKKKCMEEHVIFYGWEKNIPMIYADLDILALTSLNEGTPVSIIEAMAASVPVVTTGVGGIKDLLGRIEPDQPLGLGFKICERGILCPKDDAIAFASALKYMTDGNYLHNKHNLLKARDFVLDNYSVYRLIHEIEGLYDQLMIDGASNRG
jgi:glycosyltransferase involved in cell wall biosynthesis